MKDGPSSQDSTEPWDTTFNRATNAYKDRDKSKPPTSAGRVSGFGTSMKFVEYYSSDPEKRKERRKMKRDNTAEVVELRKKVESLEKQIVDSSTVDKLVDERIRTLIPPGLFEGLAAWNAGGQQGPIHVPSFSGSNSTMNRAVSPDLVTPPNATLQQSVPFVAPTPPPAKDTEAPPPERPEENVRPAAGTGALVSTLAEINAIDKVTN